jgi:hypothetical protein
VGVLGKVVEGGGQPRPNRESESYKIVVYTMPSARAMLAQRVLRLLEDGQSVPTDDALQLRNWAVGPDDALLSLRDLAHRILSHEEDQA